MKCSLRLSWCSIVVASAFGAMVSAQEAGFQAVRAEVDFSRTLRVWDGFAVNYVEVAQAIGCSQDPQEYGGFSLLTDDERQQIISMVFGDDGLKPGSRTLASRPVSTRTGTDSASGATPMRSPRMRGHWRTWV